MNYYGQKSNYFHKNWSVWLIRIIFTTLIIRYATVIEKNAKLNGCQSISGAKLNGFTLQYQNQFILYMSEIAPGFWKVHISSWSPVYILMISTMLEVHLVMWIGC